MELRTLATFVRVAELNNFSKAAETLGYSQSAVSSQISQLEGELNTRLFDRIGKTISLTPTGKEFLESSKKILTLTEEAKKSIKKRPVVSGKLRIAMAESISTFLFYDILKEYSALYPEVEITLTSGLTTEMLRMLHHNEVDFIYTLDRRNFDANLIIAYEAPEPVTFISHPNHPLCNKERIPLKKIVSENFILTEKGMSYRFVLDQRLASKGLEIKPIMVMGNTQMITQLVKEGRGLAFLPKFIVKDSIEKGEVSILDIALDKVDIWRQLVYHREKWVTPAMEALIDLVKKIEGNRE